MSQIIPASRILAFACVLAVGAQSAKIMWSPTHHAPNNIAGAVNGNDWYSFTDKSTLSPAHIYNSITALNRLSMEVQLNAAGGYAGMGFNWKGNNLDTNISAATGVCLTYRSARPFRLNLIQYNSPNADHYGKLIPAQSEYAPVFVPFSELAREGWGTAYTFNAQKQQGFNIQYKGGMAGSSTDSTNTIDILQVGLGNVCDLSDVPATGVPVTSTAPFWDAIETLPTQAKNTFQGTWQTYTDGFSSVTPTAGNTAAMDNFLALVHSVGFSSQLTPSTANPYPTAGVSMDWKPSQALTDLSAQEGICVTYRSNHDMRVLLEQDGLTHSNYFGASLPTQKKFLAVDLDFSTFAQESGWGYAVVQDLARQKSLRFEAKSTTQTTAELEILQVGFKGQCENQLFAPTVLEPYASMSTPLTLTEGTPLTIPLSAIFQDRDDSELTFDLGNSEPDIIQVTLEGKNLILTPVSNATGITEILLLATDSDQQSATAIFKAAVTDQELPPVAQNDAYITLEDIPLQVTGPSYRLFANDSDPDQQAITLDSYTQPSHGSVTINEDGSFSYTPLPNFHGEDAFQYTVIDPTLLTATATVTITVQPVNDKPIATGTVAVQGPFDEDFSGLKAISIPKADLSFTDPDGDPLTYHLAYDQVLQATYSTTTTHHIITLKSNPDQFGMAQLVLYVKDIAGDTAGIPIVVEITPVEDPPTLVDDSYMGLEDVAQTISGTVGVLANDLNPDLSPLSASVKQLPAHGTIEMQANGSFVYTPNPDWHGVDSFTYGVSSATTDYPEEATVTLTIQPTNDAPVLVQGATLPDITVLEDFTPALRLSTEGLFTDIDEDKLSFWAGATDKIKVTVDKTTQELVLTPVTNAFGTATVSLTATDGQVASPDTLSFTVTLDPTNDAPVNPHYIAAQSVAAGVATLEIPLDTHFTDPDGDILQYAMAVTSQIDGSFRGDTLVLATQDLKPGEYTVRLVVSDPDGATRNATFKVTIIGSQSIWAHTPMGNHWRQVVQTRQGVAQLVNIQGQPVQSFTLPCSDILVDHAIQNAPLGTYFLRVGGQSWVITP